MFHWIKKVGSYFHKVAVGADQELNVITGGNPDETVSSRAQRAADSGSVPGKIVSSALDLLQKDHGHKAESGDVRRAETVEELDGPGIEGA